MQNKKNKKGFSLIEVMVAISVITLVVLSSTTLLVSIVRSNSSNIYHMVAYGLAQEGLEAVRNMRDSDWLLNASFDGKVGKFKTPIWGAELPVLNESSFFTVDAAIPQSSPNGGVLSSQISNFAPWTLEKLSSNDNDFSKNSNTQLYKATVDGITVYTYKKITGAIATPFHRYLKITALPYGGATDVTSDVAKYRVTSVVAWSEFGRDTEVRLDTELTDWKQSTL